MDYPPNPAALFILALVLLMAALSLAAVGLVAALRWIGVDLSAWDDPPSWEHAAARAYAENRRAIPQMTSKQLASRLGYPLHAPTERTP